MKRPVGGDRVSIEEILVLKYRSTAPSIVAVSIFCFQLCVLFYHKFVLKKYIVTKCYDPKLTKIINKKIKVNHKKKKSYLTKQK